MKVTPWVRELQPNEIFIFGSNTSGRHGKGAAKTARRWGAKWGVGEGLSGQTYALPTVNASITKALSLSEIQKCVDRLYICIIEHPELFFFVTEVGCNLAGYTPSQIAPLFKNFMDLPNISLPAKFIKILEEGNKC